MEINQISSTSHQITPTTAPPFLSMPAEHHHGEEGDGQQGFTCMGTTDITTMVYQHQHETNLFHGGRDTTSKIGSRVPPSSSIKPPHQQHKLDWDPQPQQQLFSSTSKATPFLPHHQDEICLKYGSNNNNTNADDDREDREDDVHHLSRTGSNSNLTQHIPRTPLRYYLMPVLGGGGGGGSATGELRVLGPRLEEGESQAGIHHHHHSCCQGAEPCSFFNQSPPLPSLLPSSSSPLISTHGARSSTPTATTPPPPPVPCFLSTSHTVAHVAPPGSTPVQMPLNPFKESEDETIIMPTTAPSFLPMPAQHHHGEEGNGHSITMGLANDILLHSSSSSHLTAINHPLHSPSSYSTWKFNPDCGCATCCASTQQSGSRASSSSLSSPHDSS